jgi:actin
MTSKFDPKSCAVLANLALSRIRLHKNKRVEQGKSLTREVLSLLLAEKDDQARIRVVNVIHNDYYLDVLNTLEVFVNVIAASTDVLAAQISVPLEMKESVCSICYAAPFLDNSPELVKIRGQLAAKYHKDEDLFKKTFVHPKVLLGLSHDMPDDALINYYISNILQEHSTSTTKPKAPAAANSEIAPVSSPAPSAPSAPPIAVPKKTQVDPLSLLKSQAKLSEQQVMGTMRIDNNGHFWVLEEGPSQPIFIPAHYCGAAADGDLVIVTLDVRKDGKRSGKFFRNLTVEASQMPKIHESTTQQLKKSQTTSVLGMSAIASQYFVGNAKGTLILDLKQDAWVLDSGLGRPIYIPPIALETAMDGDVVQIEVFEKDKKLIGKVKSSIASSTALPSSSLPSSITPIRHTVSTEKVAKDARLRENPLLQNVPWKAVSCRECEGLFKREDDNYGMVLDEIDPLKAPVVIVGDIHRNGAQNGDRVQVLVFGEMNNPATNSTITLGQVISTLDSQPKSRIEPQKASLKDSSPSKASPVSNRTVRSERKVDLVPGDSGDFVATLELDENGNACVLHPTLPWTYVIIPKDQLAHTCVGDEISVSLVDQKPKQGKMMGKLVGIVTAVDGYSVSADIEYEIDERVDETKDWDGENSMELMESALATLQEFEPEPTSHADAQSMAFPVLDRVIPSEVIVVDIGSSTIKVGYANQPVPILAIPTVAGRLLDSLASQHSLIRPSSSTMGLGDIVVGKTAMERRSLLQLSFPFQNGSVSDWPAIRNLLLGTLTGLNMDLRRATVVVLESESGKYIDNREHLAKILFDDFKLPFVFFARAASSVLRSERKSSGIVIDIGHTSTTIVAVEDGNVLDGSRVVFPLAGLDITSRLIDLLEDDGYRMFKTESQKLAAENIKIATAFVQSTAPQATTKSAKPSTYRMEDGTELIIGDQAWKCAEILFKPTLIGQDIGGLPLHVHRMLKKFEANPQVSENLFLVGGSSCIPGLRQRLQNELQTLNQNQQVFVDHPSKAQFSKWIGGALLARLPDFKDCLLSREEYLAEGPDVIDRTFV